LVSPMAKDKIDFTLLDRLGAEVRPGGATRSLHSGGGGGTFDDMEQRVKALEEGMKEIRGDLKSLLQNTAEIKGKVDGLPSAYEFGQLKGRVDSLPTTGKVAALLGIAVAIITIITKFPEIATLFAKAGP
jgi:hypothetical protein